MISKPRNLKKGETIEIVAYLLNNGEVVSTAQLTFDQDPNVAPSFKAVSMAVQAGSYEILKAVWPNKEQPK